MLLLSDKGFTRREGESLPSAVKGGKLGKTSLLCVGRNLTWHPSHGFVRLYYYRTRTANLVLLFLGSHPSLFLKSLIITFLLEHNPITKLGSRIFNVYFEFPAGFLIQRKSSQVQHNQLCTVQENFRREYWFVLCLRGAIAQWQSHVLHTQSSLLNISS